MYVARWCLCDARRRFVSLSGICFGAMLMCIYQHLNAVAGWWLRVVYREQEIPYLCLVIYLSSCMIMVPMVIGRWLDIIGWLSGGVCSLDQLTRLLLLFIIFSFVTCAAAIGFPLWSRMLERDTMSPFAVKTEETLADDLTWFKVCRLKSYSTLSFRRAFTRISIRPVLDIHIICSHISCEKLSLAIDILQSRKPFSITNLRVSKRGKLFIMCWCC